MKKLLRDLSDQCTTQEILDVCDSITEEGHKVVIEHKEGKIQIYDDNTELVCEKVNRWLIDDSIIEHVREAEHIAIELENPSFGFRIFRLTKKIELLRDKYCELVKTPPLSDKSPVNSMVHWEYEKSMRRFEGLLKAYGVLPFAKEG